LPGHPDDEVEVDGYCAGGGRSSENCGERQIKREKVHLKVFQIKLLERKYNFAISINRGIETALMRMRKLVQSCLNILQWMLMASTLSHTWVL